MNFEDFLISDPFEFGKDRKDQMLVSRLVQLTEKHRRGCSAYRAVLETLGFGDCTSFSTVADIPFIPVRLFKELELKSVSDDDLVKTITSSGTTGQKVSRIYLDRNTSAAQQKAMVRIVSDFIGTGRMPMIILDCPSVLRSRGEFSARAAGVLGFSIFGSKKIYALDDSMNLDVDGLLSFLEKYRGRRILLFGFTFIIWQHFCRELEKLKSEGVELDLSNGVLVHGGGWKKLAAEAVDPETFRLRLNKLCGISHVHDYYGMAEQTGCICMECECHHLHASIFSDVIIRNPLDFSECHVGEPGILQVLSSIPESYPGHSLLTEDKGVLLGEDDCPCGRRGKYFMVLGRLENAELRGCSDTYAYSFEQR